MSSPKHVDNSERERGNPKSKDIFLLRSPITKRPRETSLVNLLSVKNNLGPLWTLGFFKHLGWKTSTPSMTLYQLTTVPTPLIPEELPAHFPHFWMMQLIMKMSPGRICPLTMGVTEQPPHIALPGTGKIFPSFLNFQIPQKGCTLLRTILLMCHPIKQRWLFPHPWALTVMWKLIPSTRDKPLFVEMRREAGSLPGSLSSLSDPLLSQKTAINSVYKDLSSTWTWLLGTRKLLPQLSPATLNVTLNYPLKSAENSFQEYIMKHAYSSFT